MNIDYVEGPDGFTTKFFQKSWPVIKKDLVRAILDFFNGNPYPNLLNTHSISSILVNNFITNGSWNVDRLKEVVPDVVQVAATNDSADNQGADHGEPSNIQSEADQHLRSLLTSLDKDQLVDILVVLGMKIPQAAEGIRGAARPTASHLKVIVHGFGEETTSETLGYAFSSYGEVEDANVAVDRTTGKSRCFGFITFKSLESVKKALEKQKTWVDGRLARQRPPSEAELDSADADPRDLFVTRISSDITNEMFIRFFEKYGEIEKGSLLYDKETRTSRGLGFVTFKTVEAAKAAISDPDKILGGNRISVEIKRFREKKNKVQEESETSAPPHVHNSPHAIAPQHYGLQSQVPRPHFSGLYEPHGIPIPVAYQPPTGTYQPHFIGYDRPYGIPLTYQPHFSGYEAYGIPVAYQPQTGTYQPHFSGNEAYGIPVAYQPQTGTYQPHFSGYEAYGIPIPVAYQPHFIGYVPYGIPPAYQPPTVVYQSPTGAYPPPTGFMAYPYYFAYQ
ncbi:hypothetical protein M5K25_010184 [Dendrobium thyrsiflorum]|uniref:RRM domain-containing protein n=1 Tax=Dendrobium thyrsiflorum TaxID=117978 RepID=A0ABD0UZH1_DENTH